jgi:hypothetical protein
MSSIICKKCKGPHLTIKCGKQKKNENTLQTKNYKPKTGQHFKKSFNHIDKSKKVCVKMSNLPDDITLKELNDLLQEWGSIGRINFGKSMFITAYVDFYIPEEADYFVKALDRTPFGSLIMDVQVINN